MLIFSFVSDALLLCMLLALVAQVDVQTQWPRALGVVFFAASAAVVVRFLLSGIVPWAGFVAYIAVFWFALTRLFDLEVKKRRIIIAVFLVLRILWGIVLTLR